MTNPISRRHLFGLGGGVLAAGALTACGSGTPGQSASEAQNTGAATITFWHRTFTPVENAWYKDIVKKFNAAQSKVIVKEVEVPADAWDQKMKAAQAAGKAPDIYTHAGSIDDAVSAGQLHDLDSLLPKEKLGEIIEAALPVSQLDGKFYAYPMLLEPQAVLYTNKDMVTKAGLDPEQAPTTWDELISNCEKVKGSLSSGQFALSPALDAATFAWATLGQQYNFSGHTALTDDWTKPNIDDPGYRALMETYKSLWDKDLVPKQPLATYVEAKDFGQKKVAYKIGGSWSMSEIGSDYPELLDKINLTPMVSAANADGRPASTLGNFKWVVDAKSKNAEAAGEFLAWALAGDPANLVDFFVKTQFTKAPVRKSVQEAVNADPAAAKAPWSKVITEKIAPTAIPEAKYPWDISLAVGTMIESVMKGAAPVDKALQTAETAIEKIIKAQNLPSKAPKK